MNSIEPKSEAAILAEKEGEAVQLYQICRLRAMPAAPAGSPVPCDGSSSAPGAAPRHAGCGEGGPAMAAEEQPRPRSPPPCAPPSCTLRYQRQRRVGWIRHGPERAVVEVCRSDRDAFWGRCLSRFSANLM